MIGQVSCPDDKEFVFANNPGELQNLKTVYNQKYTPYLE